MNIKEELEKMYRHTIRLDISKRAEVELGKSHFGGVPDVPSDFVWPEYETSTFDDDTVKLRPLSFIAQFNCAEILPYDKDGLLPKSGLLSFFYEVGSMCWGFDPADKGCAKVYYFEDVKELSPVEFPEELEEDYRFPTFEINASSEHGLPCIEDFMLKHKKVDWDEFDEVRETLGCKLPDLSSKLLGWPDIIQNNMTQECELVSKGYYTGNGFDEIPKQEVELAKRNSLDNWLLLFQLDIVSDDDFELMFGDCGRLYYYIRKEDLAAKKFDNIWLESQCC